MTINVIVFSVLPVFADIDKSCDFSGGPLFVGQDTDFVLCGNELPDAIEIATGDSAIARAVYLQPLRRCDVNDKRRGFHVVLNSRQSGETDLQVVDAAMGSGVCSTDVVALPDRNSGEPIWLNSMPESAARYIDVKGIKTRYFDSGSGPALVLVHGGQAGGANNSAQKWEQNFPGLTRTFRVIALDRLAQAGTDNLSTPEEYADYFSLDAQHLEDFILALGLQDVSLVGHSQGGWPVTRVALKRPDLVTCVVNVDSVMVPDNLELMREALSFIIYTASFVDPPSGPTVHSTRRAMAMRYPTGRNITADKTQRVVDQYQMTKTVKANKNMSALRMTPQNPTFKQLRDQAYAEIAAGKFQARSLVVWGELDPQVPLGLGQEFNQLLLDANVDTRLAVIDGAGHAPFVEFPDEFNDLVVSYCAE
jgi:2-hydroxy-6-oxonona-2,4-dienedioate hydrolase